MTIPHDDDVHDETPLPAALQSGLRALREPAPSTRDLWPGIEARLAAPGAGAPRVDAATRLPAAARRPRRRLAWLAMAASLVLAAGLGWRQQAAQPQVAFVAPIEAAPSPAMLELQADTMAIEYAAALRELQETRPNAHDAQLLQVLDGSAIAIRAALAEQPDARFLIDQLRRVYARRLDITRKLA